MSIPNSANTRPPDTSPLAALRLTQKNTAPPFSAPRPPSSLAPAPHSPTTRKPRKSTNPEPPSASWPGLDEPKTPQPPVTHEREIESAQRLATLFLNSTRFAHAKYNVVSNPVEGISVLRSTRGRVEAVKAMISLKYLWMAAAQGEDRRERGGSEDSVYRARQSRRPSGNTGYGGKLGNSDGGVSDNTVDSENGFLNGGEGESGTGSVTDSATESVTGSVTDSATDSVTNSIASKPESIPDPLSISVAGPVTKSTKEIRTETDPLDRATRELDTARIRSGSSARSTASAASGNGARRTSYLHLDPALHHTNTANTNHNQNQTSSHPHSDSTSVDNDNVSALNVAAHPGVENVYNPLQVLRNRAVRALHHDYPPASAMKNIPMACNAFSAHNRLHRSWSMWWGIELAEFVYDLRWRTLHWAELRDPHGRLWFGADEPRDRNSMETDAPRARLHDRLWAEKPESEWAERGALDPALSTSHLSHASTGSASNLAPHAGAHTGSGSASHGSASHLDSAESLRDELRLHIPDHQSTPIIIIGDDPHPVLEDVAEASEAVTDVPFAPVHSRDRSESEDSPDVTADEVGDEVGAHDADDSADAEESPDALSLRALGLSVRGLDRQVAVLSHFLQSVYPQVAAATQSALRRVVEHDIHLLLHIDVDIIDNVLPAHEGIYVGFLDECKSLVHMANVNYAVKIDNLLGATDRAIGELNTSLPMDLRRASETLDRLHDSLFGANPALKHLRMDVALDRRMLYTVLENAIVVILRLVWVLVSMYQMAWGAVKMVWSAATWMWV